jgi:hypothetical protein
MSGLPQMAANLKAIHSRNHHIQNDNVVGVDIRLVQRSLTCSHCVDRVGLFAKALDDEPLYAGIVFDQ